MNRVRGVVMVLAGCFALFESRRMLGGERVMIAVALGLLAIALGVWRLTRKEARRIR
jgi:hypothetical protein